MPFHVFEPHPSPQNYIHAGRGGAGNYARYNKAELTKGHEATGPASAAKVLPPVATHKFTSGRGGAGNTHKVTESQRAIFSFDEELARDQRMIDNAAKTPVYHIGRGGAGNAVDEMKPRSSSGRLGSISSASSTSSAGSTGSRKGVANALGRLTRTFSRQSAGSTSS